MRDDEGYTKTWFDEEAVSYEDKSYTYYVTAPVEDSYLYFTAESFYQAYIPADCWDYSSAGVPLTYFVVKNQNTGEQWYQFYYEVYHNPIIVGPDSFTAGD